MQILINPYSGNDDERIIRLYEYFKVDSRTVLPVKQEPAENFVKLMSPEDIKQSIVKVVETVTQTISEPHTKEQLPIILVFALDKQDLQILIDLSKTDNWNQLSPSVQIRIIYVDLDLIKV